MLVLATILLPFVARVPALRASARRPSSHAWPERSSRVATLS